MTKILRTASLGSNFAGSYKKMSLSDNIRNKMKQTNNLIFFPVLKDEWSENKNVWNLASKGKIKKQTKKNKVYFYKCYTV